MPRDEVAHLTKYGCFISISMWLTLAVNLLRLIVNKVIEIPSIDVAAFITVLFLSTACVNTTFYAFSFYLLSKGKQNAVNAVYKNLSIPMVINLFFCVPVLFLATSHYAIAIALTVIYILGAFLYYAISTHCFIPLLDEAMNTCNNKLDFRMFIFFMLWMMCFIVVAPLLVLFDFGSSMKGKERKNNVDDNNG